MARASDGQIVRPSLISDRRKHLMPHSYKGKSKPKSQPPTAWGGEVAEWYGRLVGEEGSEYHREVVLPGAARLLAIQPGETALDIACGQGVLCRLLHEKGASVTGVDAAADLIRVARLRSGPDIAYHVGDARELGFLPAGRFDAAAC